MTVGSVQMAKRALVSLMLALADGWNSSFASSSSLDRDKSLRENQRHQYSITSAWDRHVVQRDFGFPHSWCGILNWDGMNIYY